jgi:hypothetical protein
VDYKPASVDEAIDLRKPKHTSSQLERYAGLFVNEGLPAKKAVLFLTTGYSFVNLFACSKMA